MDRKYGHGYPQLQPGLPVPQLPAQMLHLPDVSTLAIYGAPAQPLLPQLSPRVPTEPTAFRLSGDGALASPDYAQPPAGTGGVAPPAPSAVMARERNKAAQRAYRQRNKVLPARKQAGLLLSADMEGGTFCWLCWGLSRACPAFALFPLCSQDARIISSVFFCRLFEKGSRSE